MRRSVPVAPLPSVQSYKRVIPVLFLSSVVVIVVLLHWTGRHESWISQSNQKRIQGALFFGQFQSTLEGDFPSPSNESSGRVGLQRTSVPQVSPPDAGDSTLKKCEAKLVSSTVPAELTNVPDEKSLTDELSKTGLGSGGRWKPSGCIGRDKVAIVIPFRNREKHLLLFAKHMHPFLQRQKLEYAIYVVDQQGNTPFNRAMLMNIGFLEAMLDLNWRCFAFHDIDHLPVDDALSYACDDDRPVHMSEKTDKWGWGLPYSSFVGGVTKQLTEHIYKMNGFANFFWGWGGEDDDILVRWKAAGLNYKRPGGTGKYVTMKLHHSVSSAPNPERFKLLSQSPKRWRSDGLNNVLYHVVDTVRHPLYTRIKVRVKKK